MNLYSEDALVEQPALSLLAEMGWTCQNCSDEFQSGSSSLGRETKSEVVLTTRLRDALKRLNPTATGAAITAAIDILTDSRARMGLVHANREVYALLKDGITVTTNDPTAEEETPEVLRVIDWESPENNDFFAASQLSVTGEMYTRRPDLIGFVNGMPLVLMEFKRIDVSLHDAYAGNLRDYKDTIPHLFWYNGFVVFSNGADSRVGSLTAEWEHFSEWKRVEREDETPEVSLATLLKAVCSPERLLDILENFVLFVAAQGGVIKVLAKNHQYLGVNNTLRSLAQLAENRGKLGVFWHTQGSGKSLSMLFFAQKVLRKVYGNWTFVVVTDRKELDDQIYKTFASVSGVLTQQAVHAENVAHLRELLGEDHRYVFTLIHKFQTRDNGQHPILSERSDIVVMTDEAHRSQYDTLALNMRTALPNAAYVAFTGTPLMAGEEQTKAVFGDYVSIYDFSQSIADGATVPLYYENRVPKLQLVNPDLNEGLERILEAAELDAEQEAKLEREFAREYHLITREERLGTVAADIVSHFMDRGYRGKAMVISIDKATAVKMYDKVQKAWQHQIELLRSELATYSGSERRFYAAKLGYMAETDMAVVVSPSQNEIDDLRQKGVDITPHRVRMNTEDLDTKFKDPNDPFRIVFVCAMWITGFDVPSCSTIYLDKPQRNHTLMQTIARANRVFGDKNSGLIVDYIGVFRALEKALAIYATGAGGDGKTPIADKSALLEKLRAAIAEISDFCEGLGVDLRASEETEPLQSIASIEAAVDAVLKNDETKKQYLELATGVFKLYKAILPDPEAHVFRQVCSLIRIIAQKIRGLTEPPDVSGVMTAVEDLLDESIAPEGYLIEGPADSYDTGPIDLSEIDFEQLSERFAGERKRLEAERLRGAIDRKLTDMIRLNRNRMDYQAQFEQMIAAYNDGTLNVEMLLEGLFDFAGALQQEDQRAGAEALSEEELAVFDLLTRPDPDLTVPERDEVKTAVRMLLETLKQEKLGLDWRKRTQAKAAVKEAVSEILDSGLPHPYTHEVFNRKSEAVYQHIYDSYYGEGRSIYTEN